MRALLLVLSALSASALHLGLLMRLSSQNTTTSSAQSLGDSWKTVTVAALWAVQQANERPATNALVPNLTASGLAACPSLAVTLANRSRTVPSVHDTESLPRIATDRYLRGAYRPNVTCLFPDPAWDAVIGPMRSACSTPVAMLGGLQKRLSVSPWSTSPDLEDQAQYPYFTRTIAQDDSTILAIISWLQQNTWTRVGLLYIKDEWGSGFATSLAREFSSRSMELVSQSFNENDAASITTAVGQLASQRVRIVISLNFDTDFVTIVDAGIAAGILGAGHHWIWGTGQQWSGLSAAQAAAVDGSALIEAQGAVSTYAPWAAFLSEWRNLSAAAFNGDLPLDHQLDVDFFIRTADSVHDLASYAFDAVAAVVLAGCKAAPATDTPSLYGALVNLTFEGVSGDVRFTATGSRTFASSSFFLTNIRLAARRSNSLETVVVKGYDHTSGAFAASCGICGGRSFLFTGGSALAPSDVWPTDDDDDQTLPIALGASLGGAFLIGLVGFGVYWWRTRSQLQTMERQIEDMEKALVGVVKTCQPVLPAVGNARFYWQEDEARLAQHPSNRVQAPCWVLYDPREQVELERAYQQKQAKYTTDGYEVELQTLDRADPDATVAEAQRSRATGYRRGIRRCGPVAGHDQVALHVGVVDTVPDDLRDQPRLVVGADALVNIQRRRDEDDWVWAQVMKRPEDDDVLPPDDSDAFSLDAGWLPESLTIAATQDDLKELAEALGGGSLDAPDHWEVDDGADPTVAVLKRVPLDSPEIAEVLERFAQTMNVKIVKWVDRVQNLAAWQSYVMKLQTMLGRGDMTREELEVPIMFHGSNEAVADAIMQQGFNRSFAGKNATVYGCGCYFAHHANYSCQKTYAVPNGVGEQVVFVASVIRGHACVGKRDQRQPDMRIADKKIPYDSTVDSLGPDASMVVTYHDSQVVPIYKLTIKQ